MSLPTRPSPMTFAGPAPMAPQPLAGSPASPLRPLAGVRRLPSRPTSSVPGMTLASGPAVTNEPGTVASPAGTQQPLAGAIPRGPECTVPKPKRPRPSKARPIMDAPNDGSLAWRVLEFVMLYKYATAVQLARHFGLTEAVATALCAELVLGWMLHERPVLQGAYPVFVPTGHAKKAVGSPLTVPHLQSGTAAHTLGQVDLAIHWCAQGETVISEREIRFADTSARVRRHRDGQPAPGTGSPNYALVPGAPILFALQVGGFRKWPHIPDMVLARPLTADGLSGNVAIELELNRKSPDAWRNILRGYRDAPHFRHVLYLTHDQRVTKPLQKIIDQLGLGDKVTINDFHPSKSIPWDLLPEKP